MYIYPLPSQPHNFTHYISYNLDHYLYKIVRFPQWQSAAFHASQSIVIIKAQMSFRKPTHPLHYWCFLNSFTYEKSAKDNLRLLTFSDSKAKWRVKSSRPEIIGCKLLHGIKGRVLFESWIRMSSGMKWSSLNYTPLKPSVFKSSRDLSHRAEP